jgi:hypothetical protein
MNRPSSRTGPVLAAVLSLLVVCGCQRYYQVEYAPVPSHAASHDEAMALRDWNRSTAHYASGDVIAGPTNANMYYPIGEPGDDGYVRRQRLGILLEPLVAVGNIVAMPVSLALDPPTEQRRYEGTVVDPTYTAAVAPSELQRETPQGRQALERARRQEQREASGEQRPPRQNRPVQEPGGRVTPTGARGAGGGS